MIPSWLNFTQTSGSSGTTVITVSAGTYNDVFERGRVLTVKTNGNSYVNLIIIQKAISGDTQ